MKRKKNHLEKFHPDKYRDGPKKPLKPQKMRRVRDPWDEDIYEDLNGLSMRNIYRDEEE